MPLIFASLGEIIAEQSGVLNVGLEGMMLTGAFVGFLATLAFGDLWLGLAAGAVAGLLVSLVMVVFCIRLGLDQIVVGIAIVLTAEGGTASSTARWYRRLVSTAGRGTDLRHPDPVRDPDPRGQPVQPTAAGLRRPRPRRRSSPGSCGARVPGLHLRAAGERPASPRRGRRETWCRVRTAAELACGALAGLGGAYLVIVGAGTFVPFVTHGTGFIAIVIAMLARGRPWWSVAGAFLFGMSLSLTTALQLVGIAMPIDVVQMLPFVSVLIVLIIFARDARLPSALGLPYLRGSR